MKHCSDCQFHERAAVPMQGNQMGMMDVCTHEECSNPVDGAVLPCGMVRQNVDFCGIKAKHFKKKEHEPTPQGKVIQMPS